MDVSLNAPLHTDFFEPPKEQEGRGKVGEEGEGRVWEKRRKKEDRVPGTKGSENSMTKLWVNYWGEPE